MRTLFTTLSLILAPNVTAQNFVTNGGFTSDYSGWKLSKLVLPGISKASITGVSSPAAKFQVFHGSPATLSQTVNLKSGLHRLRLFAGANLPSKCRVRVTARLFNTRSQIDCFSQSVDLYNPGPVAQFEEGLLDLLPRRPITSDRYLLSIDFRFFGTTTPQRCSCLLDSVELTAARHPVSSIDRVTSLSGKQATLRTITTSPSSHVFQGLAARRLAKPIPVPGFVGALELDPTSLIVFRAGWRSGAIWYTRLPVWPASAKGVKFYAQSFSLVPQGTGFVQSLGSSSWHAMH